jgi:hypothetical protein
MSYPGDHLKEGWGVLCSGPRHIAGVYKTREEAEERVKVVGPLYRVAYGRVIAGVGFTDDLIYGAPKS